ncbi:GGDEF domain-containing protein [Nitratidesulfovibrio termitidis]|uniref:GGDEF domain-containing protein n=1 Tax=Nitratidesulfovibrio termitidis TaxID=42252 RepID=UPI00040AC24F|nr:GGDEF domain-containing protein [Nitratidesulfovibrio termitidis]
MKHTELTLCEQMHIGVQAVDRRLRLVGVTREDCATLKRFKSVITANTEELVDEFYDVLSKVDEVARLIGDKEGLLRLKRSLTSYVLTLFDGEYGLDYVQSRLRVGLVHKRIGVTPKLFMTAVLHLIKMLRLRIRSEVPGMEQQLEVLHALEKVVFFDLALIFDTYIQSLMDEILFRSEDLTTYAKELEQMVAERTRELEDLAHQDGLTGIPNQRHFRAELRREFLRAQRMGTHFVLAYVDLDQFKAANDTWGHKAGDQILEMMAECLRGCSREGDVPARYGGDEFCAILVDTDMEGAKKWACRLIDSFDASGDTRGVTLSIGLARYDPAQDMEPEHLLKRADAAMYRAKLLPGHATMASECDEVELECEAPQPRQGRHERQGRSRARAVQETPATQIAETA